MKFKNLLVKLKAIKIFGYGENFIGRLFRTTPDGHRIFCPFLSNKQSYLIPTEEEYEKIRRELKRIQGIIETFNNVLALTFYLAESILRFPFFYWLLTFAINYSLVQVIFLLMIRHQRQGLEPAGKVLATKKLTLKESFELQASAMPTAILRLCQLSSIVMVPLGILWLIMEPEERGSVLTMTILIGLGAIFSFFMLRLKRKLEMKKGMAPGEAPQ